MDKSEKQCHKVISADLRALRIGWGRKYIVNGGEKNSHGNKEFNDGRGNGQYIECGQRKGNRMADGKGCNQDQHMSPLAHVVYRA